MIIPTSRSGRFEFFPGMDHLLPGEIVSHPMECWQFGLLCEEQIAPMFEGYDIAWLGIPPFAKFSCACCCCKSDPVWSKKG